MDISKAFKYVFDDPSWLKKVLFGALFSIIPIIGSLVVGGYGMKVAQNVARGVEQPLPEWDDFGGNLTRGFYGAVIYIAYSLPVFILQIILQVFIGVGANMSENGDGGGAIGLVALCLMPILFALSIACGLLGLNAVARFLVHDNLSEAFKFNEVLSSLRGSLGPWLMLLVLYIMASIVGSLGVIACGIGLIFTLPYAQFVMAHGLGQTIGQLFPGIKQPAAPYIPTSTTQL